METLPHNIAAVTLTYNFWLFISFQKMPNLKGLTKKLISMNDQIKKKASSKPATELQQSVLSLMKQLLLLIPC